MSLQTETVIHIARSVACQELTAEFPSRKCPQSKKPCPGSFPFSGTPHPVIYTCKRLDLHTFLLQLGALNDYLS